MKGCDCEEWGDFGNRCGANAMGLRDGWEYCPFCGSSLIEKVEEPERFWCEGCGGLKLTKFYKCSWCGYEKKPLTLIDLAKRGNNKQMLEIAETLSKPSRVIADAIDDAMVFGVGCVFISNEREWRKL